MRCVYPQCRANVEEENAWCEAHKDTTCAYPLFGPLCQEHVIPKSAYCVEHDKLASFTMLLHGQVHQQAAQAQAEAQRDAMLVKRGALHLLNGHG